MSDEKRPPAQQDTSPPPYIDNGPAPVTPRRVPRGPFPLDIPVLARLRDKRIILASASPRRKQILSIIFPKVEVVPSKFPENLDKDSLGPYQYVLQTATEKCVAVYQEVMANTPESIPDPALVIAGDTIIVTMAGTILEKPRSEQEHMAMLKTLRDQKTHRVFTAVVVMAPREDARHPGYNLESRVVETSINMDQDATDELIEAYVRTREGADKAGGYGIQGMGGILIESVQGSWDNVVGLPLRVVLALTELVVFQQQDALESETE